MKENEGSSEWPGSEYRKLDRAFTNFLIIMRFSLGDFDFEAVNHLDKSQAYIFWIMWMLIVVMSCVIFLNFIIAEVA